MNTENSEVQVDSSLLQDHLLAQPSPQNYVPFLLKANRFVAPCSNQSSPAIGTYNLRSCFDTKITACTTKIHKFIQDAHRQKQQMGIFKSSIQRFQSIKNMVPGPAAYNLFKNANRIKIRCPALTQKPLNEEQKELSKTCPSIPDKKIKFGYNFEHGKPIIIQKGLQQLQKEEISRKTYAQTLKGEKLKIRNGISNRSFRQQNEKTKLYLNSRKIMASTRVTEQKQKEKQNQRSKQKQNTDSRVNPTLKQMCQSKKSKHEHLYHSKGIDVLETYKLLGPGSYDVPINAFHIQDKKQKFQFFGSSEVRFKSENQPVKGFSLLESIKLNKNLQMKEKPSNNLKKQEQRNTMAKEDLPGPGQYEPHDTVIKKYRGASSFPHQKRFKETQLEQGFKLNENRDSQFSLIATSQCSKEKTFYAGCLKKERFKPLHNYCEPVKSEQIQGILNQHESDTERQAKRKEQIQNHRQRTKNYGSKSPKMQKKTQFFDNQQISSWQDDKKYSRSSERGNYIRELKEELAQINIISGQNESFIHPFNKRITQKKETANI